MECSFVFFFYYFIVFDTCRTISIDNGNRRTNNWTHWQLTERILSIILHACVCACCSNEADRWLCILSEVNRDHRQSAFYFMTDMIHNINHIIWMQKEWKPFFFSFFAFSLCCAVCSFLCGLFLVCKFWIYDWMVLQW